MGFERSQHDQCLFMHKQKKITSLLCTDDCLLFSETDEMIKEMILTMQKMFSLTKQDVGQDVFDCLGIELTFKGTKVTMRQDGLMKKIFKTTKWEELKGDKTPAREKPMGADLEGKPFKEEWECASVVGMSMFPVNTSPDIQFAVHQCARFTHSPKHSHSFAVKRAVSYTHLTLPTICSV